MKPKPTTLGWLAFASGLTSPILFNFLGQMYLGEVILMLLTLVILADKCIPSPLLIRKSVLEEPIFQAFLLALAITLLGLVISDFWVGSPVSNYLRGWARLIFMATSMIALCFLGHNNPWNLWWHSLGIGCGGLMNGIQQGDIISDWKFGYSVPITLLLLCIVPLANQRLTSAAILILGLLSVVLDYRSLGLFCIILATIVWVKSSSGLSREQIFRLILALCLSLFLLMIAYTSFTNRKTDIRREESNAGRFAGVIVAVKAITDSPVLGYGSWAQNRALTSLYLDLSGGRRGFQSWDRLFAATSIPAHSQMLQSWVEGGILGATFFVFFGYKLISGITYIVVQRPYNNLLPLFLFNLLNSTWNLFASPFGGNHRVPIAVAVAILCVLSFEVTYGWIKRPSTKGIV
jgi:hypothetical protein